MGCSSSLHQQAADPEAARGMSVSKIAIPEGPLINPDEVKKMIALRATSPVWQSAQAMDNTINHQTGKKKVVLVGGPPGAGKGTLCDNIVDAYGLIHISAGDLLREHVRLGTELGVAARSAMEKGELVATDVVIAAVEERLTRADVANRGCLLDNFPLTAEQASRFGSRMEIDLFILLEVPQSTILHERAAGRRIDPATGMVYHVKHRPPPPEAAGRLQARPDDSPAALAARIATWHRHAPGIRAAVAAASAEAVAPVDASRPPADVFAHVARLLDARGWGPSEESPYIGSKAFGGRFSASDARRAGFYSEESPPYENDAVVCFRRGADFQRRGRVMSVEEHVASSDSRSGLLAGAEGAWVSVAPGGGGGSARFGVWAAFLAPLNDMEYSSVCTSLKMLKSNYWRLAAPTFVRTGSGGAVDKVSDAEAKESLRAWLEQLTDADGEPVEMAPATLEELLSAFGDGHESEAAAEKEVDGDERTGGGGGGSYSDGSGGGGGGRRKSPSLYLYTTETQLAQRTTGVLGLDFSVYHRALNNTLNNDSEAGLRVAMPLLRHMAYAICHLPSGAPRRLLHAIRVWKGDAQRPVPLNRQKLEEAAAMGTAIRFRQFQSTTSDPELASKYRRREDGRGFCWTIDVPEGFVGCRAVSDVAWRAHESEVLFAPYCAFLVVGVAAEGCHLLAVSMKSELEGYVARHGLRGTAVELIEY